MDTSEKIVVVGLGYVGLPVALAFARKYQNVVGFDISERRVDELKQGIDRTHEVDPAELKKSTIKLTTKLDEVETLLGGGACTFFVVTVPTPIDGNRQPDLTPVVKASETVGKLLKPGAVVVYESTVYPGVTEDVCAPILSRVSGLSREQYKLGYSPERINPGDKEHTLETTTKVVSGEDGPTLDRVASAYAAIVPAGVHRAGSIKVAEAAKVIENTQRDLNIALMNELALIFDKIGISTKDVLEAAGTKWNFLRFSPGLVGGHCIGVDPYYLTSKAQSLGYNPEVILAGRRINDSMGAFIGQRLVKLLIEQGVQVKGAKVGVFGLTFKENVPDLRNSRVPDIIAELRQFGIEPLVHDPRADAEEAEHEYGLELSPLDRMTGLDAIVMAVSHREFQELRGEALLRHVRKDGVIVDVKAMLDPQSIPAGIKHWAL